MDFDLLCEFYGRVEEAKKGFNYFPQKWADPIILKSLMIMWGFIFV